MKKDRTVRSPTSLLEPFMFNRLPGMPTVELSANAFETPIQIDLQAFLDFSYWMSEELLDLEARYADPRRAPEKVKH